MGITHRSLYDWKEWALKERGKKKKKKRKNKTKTKEKKKKKPEQQQKKKRMSTRLIFEDLGLNFRLGHGLTFAPSF